MRELTLDLRNFEQKEALHRCLKQTLGFPPYYGENLDALHDELTAGCEDLTLRVVYPKEPAEALRAYMPLLIRVIEDAAEENRHLHIHVEQMD